VDASEGLLTIGELLAEVRVARPEAMHSVQMKHKVFAQLMSCSMEGLRYINETNQGSESLSMSFNVSCMLQVKDPG